MIVSSNNPSPVRIGKGELGTTGPGRSLHPQQPKPGRLEMLSWPTGEDWALHTSEDDLVEIKHKKYHVKSCTDIVQSPKLTVASVRLTLGS